MIVDDRPAGRPPSHLTYCTNIHAGESWAEVQANLKTYVCAVKARLAPDRPFGVGLRLSAAAARQLAAPDEIARFKDFLRANGLYVFTINGFPYGAFHNTVVKEQVYRPDWLEDERVVYTDILAAILARLLPADVAEGSISTVPGCFRERGPLAAVAPDLAGRLARQAVTLWRLREQGGPTLGLALEPEPHCVLETVAETVSFFQQHVFDGDGVREFAAATGLGRDAAEAALRAHLGVCLDACHAAVEFEDSAGAVRAFAGAGIRIFKLQVSAGLRIQKPNAAALDALSRFAEGVYLHQVVVRRGTQLQRFVDLPEALSTVDAGNPGDEWRIHFHVPLFLEQLGAFSNTQGFLSDMLHLQSRAPFTQHLEVETYTWDVLPEEYRREPVVDAITRELNWTMDRLKEGRRT